MQPVIKILIGLPRSGKSTWAKQNQTRADVILSADDLRYLVYNQRFWQGGEPLMLGIMDIILKMLIDQQKDLIIDRTNITKRRRQGIIEIARANGYRVDGVVFTTPKEVCIERAKKHNQEDLIPVIESLSAQYEQPSRDEGFDEIFYN